MGLSSNARLLSITARLTSNEYESQQVSNAKMRLATQSQEASEEYIRALNTTDYAFVSYDSEGNCVNVPLTAAVLYQYAGSKNQYILSNSAGQALVSPEDAKNYEKSANLQEFLEKYGIKANYRTETLKENAEFLQDNKNYLDDWQKKVKEYRETEEYSTNNWQTEYANNKNTYNEHLEIYNSLLDARAYGEIAEIEGYTYDKKDGVYKNTENKNFTLNDIINNYAETLADAKANYANTVSYDTWVEHLLSLEEPEAYKNYQEYQTALKNYNIELEEHGIDATEAYSYDDSAKAQWYTNLWNRMNGESAVRNENANYYQALDLGLLTSTSWVRDALAHGTITIEVANAASVQKSVADENTPTIINSKGVNWTPKIFTNCSDITQRDDDKAIEKAEAVYKKAMAEITAKDEKYQRKLSLLDTEHNAIQNEYESVKSALGKNIERSFKTFQG